jgi:hypothetical protein
MGEILFIYLSLKTGFSEMLAWVFLNRTWYFIIHSFALQDDWGIWISTKANHLNTKVFFQVEFSFCQKSKTSVAILEPKICL